MGIESRSKIKATSTTLITASCCHCRIWKKSWMTVRMCWSVVAVDFVWSARLILMIISARRLKKMKMNIQMTMNLMMTMMYITMYNVVIIVHSHSIPLYWYYVYVRMQNVHLVRNPFFFFVLFCTYLLRTFSRKFFLWVIKTKNDR